MKYILTLIYLFLLLNLSSQSYSPFGLLPNININYKMKKDWDLTLKAESYLYQTNVFNIHRLDLWFAVSKKISHQSKLRIGYQVLLDSRQRTRFNQQYNYVKKHNKLKLAHRLSTDQTFWKNNVSFRLRYRLAQELPLNGENLDSKEFFLKFSQELIGIMETSGLGSELRTGFYIGRKTNDKNKFEIGLDYRLNYGNQYFLWNTISWYKSIN